MLQYGYTRGSFYFRGRKCGTTAGWPSVFDTVYPPAPRARADRLNNAGEPLLYASTRPDTVFAELNAQTGDFIHLIGLRVKQRAGVCLFAIGDWSEVYQAGFSRITAGDPVSVLKRMMNDMGVESARRIVYVDAFLSSILADALAVTNGYLHTRTLREAVFRKRLVAEGFFYPSVKHRVGMNLAVKTDAFDAKFQVCASQVVEITRVREFGFFDFVPRRHAKYFDENGEFLWLPEDEQHEFVVFGMTKEEEQYSRARGGFVPANDAPGFIRAGYAPVDDD